MSGISLTASMRSNLLSLQDIASQQDIVQNRLATGLKVSSAIDNPSSYYTASSLNNRASDLSALLDAMSQGIQTIKAASEAITSGTKFLEQAKAVASQALIGNNWIEKEEQKIDYSQFTKLNKSWFETQVGANGAVVETAQELKDAVAAGKETIVVYGNINMTETIYLQENQKLVGTEYFADINQNALYRENSNEHFSQINFTFSSAANGIYVGHNNVTISDLKVTVNEQKASDTGTIYVREAENVTLHNLNVKHQAESVQSSAIRGHKSKVTISGKMNVESYNANNAHFGIYFSASTASIKNAQMDIVAWSGIIIGRDTKLTIEDNSDLSITAKDSAFALNSNTQGGNSLDIQTGTVINAQAKCLWNNSPSEWPNSQTGQNDNYIHVAQNVKIYWQDPNTARTFIETHSAWETSSNIKSQKFTGTDLKTEAGWQLLTGGYHQIPNIKPYLQLLSQYDNLIRDSFYKGVNLLTGQNLKINFNEDRSSKIDVSSVKADSESLGLKTKEWKTAEDIEKSVSELEEAINTLRGFASQFGNYYSIVTTRQDFTENLINVLEEGADKLTLADMNQESANMLALQTAQQLAVNSLSLASQAAQSILRLF